MIGHDRGFDQLIVVGEHRDWRHISGEKDMLHHV